MVNKLKKVCSRSNLDATTSFLSICVKKCKLYVGNHWVVSSGLQSLFIVSRFLVKCLARIEQILRSDRIVPASINYIFLFKFKRVKFMFMLTLHMFTFQKKKFHTKICFGVKDIEKILLNHHLWLDHKF